MHTHLCLVILAFFHTVSAQQKPIIKELHINSKIISRYATTLVTSRVINPNINSSQEVNYYITLPESAFISNFTIEIDGAEYVARVEEKEEAKQQYDAAVAAGQTAAHVQARDTNNFEVSVNVGAGKKVTFRLTYEEMLKRQLGFYQSEINISPGEVVNKLSVNVYIEETRNIVKVVVPEIKNDVEIDSTEKNNKLARIRGMGSKSVHISYAPNKRQQKLISADGISGQFIVKYDVDRNVSQQELQVVDGYFVHFFAPPVSSHLNKHAVFVLDTSGSMGGRKMEQMKSAMDSILKKLKAGDKFSIVEFDSSVKIWNGEGTINLDRVDTTAVPASTRILSTIRQFPTRPSPQSPPIRPGVAGVFGITQSAPSLPPINVPEFPQIQAFPVNTANINLAKRYVQGLEASGGTNINAALLEGIRQTTSSSELVPLIIFLTDGEATSGETSSDAIIKNVRSANSEKGDVNMFTLAFGTGADYNFLKKLSLRNNGFARKIYEASDASLQLESFYEEISVPLLSNVVIRHLNDTLIDQSSITTSHVGNLFGGGEIVFTGRLISPCVQPRDVQLEVEADSAAGKGTFREVATGFRPVNDIILPILPPLFNCTFSRPPRPQGKYSNFLERLWAYRTIKNILDDVLRTDDTDEKKVLEDKATKLSLKYNFVTELTSMIVVKPDGSKNESLKENTQDQNGGVGGGPFATRLGGGFSGGPVPFSAHRNYMAARPQYSAVNFAAPPQFTSFQASFPGAQMQPATHSMRRKTSRPRTSRPRPLTTTIAFQPFTTSTTMAPPNTAFKKTFAEVSTVVTWSHLLTEDALDYSIQVNGTNYNLGFNETSNVSYGSCRTTSDSEGTCRRIQFCLQPQYLHVPMFVDNACFLGASIAVCCPDVPDTAAPSTTITPPFTFSVR